MPSSDVHRFAEPAIPAYLPRTTAERSVPAAADSPKTLSGFEEIFRNALAQAARDYEMHRLFEPERYA